MSMGEAPYMALCGLVLHVMALRHRLYRRRLAAARAWQIAERETLAERQAARARLLEQAQAVPDPVRAPRGGAGHAA